RPGTPGGPRWKSRESRRRGTDGCAGPPALLPARGSSRAKLVVQHAVRLIVIAVDLSHHNALLRREEVGEHQWNVRDHGQGRNLGQRDPPQVAFVRRDRVRGAGWAV